MKAPQMSELYVKTGATVCQKALTLSLVALLETSISFKQLNIALQAFLSSSFWTLLKKSTSWLSKVPKYVHEYHIELTW